MAEGSWRRWGAVGVGAAALVALPPVIAALPARDSSISAATLLAKVNSAGNAGYSGYAEAVGGLRLPLSDQFSSLVDLFGSRTRLRVWWRNARDWRVDAVNATGETDVHQHDGGSWTWEYERGEATISEDAPVRLPAGADLDPAQLGRRLLSEADAAHVSRLPAERVAGVDAPGLRVRPDDPQTTVTAVDAWVDPATGLPLRVAVHGTGQGQPAMQTTFLDFTPRAPDAATTAFQPPPDGRVDAQQIGDLAARINQFAPVQPPDVLAGYERRRRVEGLGAIGTYGRGVVVLVAVPLQGRLSGPLWDTLAKTPAAEDKPGGISLSVGPLSLLLSDVALDGRSWLLAGTVTVDTLRRASADLAGSEAGQ